MISETHDLRKPMCLCVPDPIIFRVVFCRWAPGFGRVLVAIVECIGEGLARALCEMLHEQVSEAPGEQVGLHDSLAEIVGTLRQACLEAVLPGLGGSLAQTCARYFETKSSASLVPHILRVQQQFSESFTCHSHLLLLLPCGAHPFFEILDLTSNP
jgi:hypothetical protein